MNTQNNSLQYGTLLHNNVVPEIQAPIANGMQPFGQANNGYAQQSWISSHPSTSQLTPLHQELAHFPHSYGAVINHSGANVPPMENHQAHIYQTPVAQQGIWNEASASYPGSSLNAAYGNGYTNTQFETNMYDHYTDSGQPQQSPPDIPPYGVGITAQHNDFNLYSYLTSQDAAMVEVSNNCAEPPPSSLEADGSNLGLSSEVMVGLSSCAAPTAVQSSSKRARSSSGSRESTDGLIRPKKKQQRYAIAIWHHLQVC